MPNFYNMLKPVEGKDAYYLSDVLKLFTPHRRKTFDTWLQSQEVTVVDDRGIITKEQLEEFFNTLSV